MSSSVTSNVVTAPRADTYLTDALLVMMAIIWGVNSSVMKAATNVMPPLVFNAARLGLAAIALVALALGMTGLARRARAGGVAALRPLLMVVCVAGATAGGLLAALPGMDHHWLNWLEAAMPDVQRAFLTDGERAVHAESTVAVARARVEVQRLRGLQQDVQWGAQAMDSERRERLRQFLASRSEIAAGDAMVLRTLRARARGRQRYWIGVPLVMLGMAGLAVLRPWRRALRPAPI